jgi:XTP/dITP diphosphohydrolase
MYQEIVIASNNTHKIEEYRNIFKNCPIIFYSLGDLNLDIDPEENGHTYEENALIKAREVAKYVSLPIIADDSGMEVTALDNKPGIFSARFAKQFKSQRESNQYIIDSLKNKTDRSAKFECVIILYISKDKQLVFKGETKGHIIDQINGLNGFGYDPIFCPDDSKKTYAEMGKEEKNKISHRAKAAKKLQTFLLFNNYKL